MPRRKILKSSQLGTSLAIGALAALASCRSAYGVDPETDPEGAVRLPSLWRADLTGGLLGPSEFEHYHVEFDGTSAWVFASVNARPNGSRQWQRELKREEYESFVRGALALDPFAWVDRSMRGPSPEKLRFFIRAGDRGRSVLIEGPGMEEVTLLDRMRLLAGPYPASASTSSR